MGMELVGSEGGGNSPLTPHRTLCILLYTHVLFDLWLHLLACTNTNHISMGLFRSLCILHFCIFGRKFSIFEVLNVD